MAVKSLILIKSGRKSWCNNLVLNNGRKFHMEMSSEPIIRLDVEQQVFGCRTTQPVLFYFLAEILLFPQQLVYITVVIYSSRPVVGQKYINRSRNLEGEKNQCEKFMNLIVRNTHYCLFQMHMVASKICLMYNNYM